MTTLQRKGNGESFKKTTAAYISTGFYFTNTGEKFTFSVNLAQCVAGPVSAVAFMWGEPFRGSIYSGTGLIPYSDILPDGLSPCTHEFAS